jgi:hypothetical protein
MPASSDDSIEASNFGPKPLTPRSRWPSTAARNASSESIPSSSKSLRARFGPRPGRRVMSSSPAGYFARSFTAEGMSPVSMSATIFSSSVLPIPGSDVTAPLRASPATETVASRAAFAADR